MPIFKRRNNCGFKARNVPHSKGVTSEKLQNSPGRYRRLPEDMDQMVRDWNERKCSSGPSDGKESKQLINFQTTSMTDCFFFRFSYNHPIYISAIWLIIQENDLERVGFVYLKLACKNMRDQV